MPKFASYGYYAEVVGYAWDDEASCPRCASKHFGPNLYVRAKQSNGEVETPREGFTMPDGTFVTSLIVSGDDDNVARYIGDVCVDCHRYLLRDEEYVRARKRIAEYRTNTNNDTNDDCEIYMFLEWDAGPMTW